MRTGFIEFTSDFPLEPPTIQFDERVIHPHVDGTKYKLDVEKWSQHNLSMQGLLLDIHEQFTEAVDFIDETSDNQIIFDINAMGFN